MNRSKAIELIAQRAQLARQRKAMRTANEQKVKVAPKDPTICVKCDRPRMVSPAGKTLSMCQYCQREYWRNRKTPNAKTRRPIKPTHE